MSNSALSGKARAAEWQAQGRPVRYHARHVCDCPIWHDTVHHALLLSQWACPWHGGQTGDFNPGDSQIVHWTQGGHARRSLSVLCGRCEMHMDGTPAGGLHRTDGSCCEYAAAHAGGLN